MKDSDTALAESVILSRCADLPGGRLCGCLVHANRAAESSLLAVISN
jgi:hypothetical protein